MTEAGSLEQEGVISALDHAKIPEGPGGPAAMVPGQHHVRMNMYIAQARDGVFKVVKDLGVIDPKERVVSGGPEAHAVTAWTDRRSAVAGLGRNDESRSCERLWHAVETAGWNRCDIRLAVGDSAEACD